MELQLIAAMFSFAFVTSVTPGPNNLMLLASGANFGFKRTIPHMLGIACGMILLLLVTLLGLGEIFNRLPSAQLALKVIGVLYLLWLAWKIASAPIAETGDNPKSEALSTAQPMRCWQAAAFQFVNPKAWMMALGAVSSFTLTGEQYWLSGLALIIVFFLVNLPSISLWAGFGVVIQQFLSSARRKRQFNIIMGLLTAATVWMIVGV
ncbi:LysE family translocator [uncultured Thiothrix sp.]|uniref:LysE family translocator n=1 Tax=uncultured Thiothrix sp. TaxID=223185 RepID=UPI0026336B92|nr:LysE family translocator [uncultured Thiothrix sp.]